MNYIITPASLLTPLIPSLADIVAKRGGPVADKYELEDTVLRCGGYAWDIGTEAAPLHAQIAKLLAAKKTADEAAEAARVADELANPRPWRVSKDTIMTRLDAVGKLAAAKTLLEAQTPLDQYRFNHAAWFWNTNARLRGLCAHASIALDPAAVLAPDEFLT